MHNNTLHARAPVHQCPKHQYRFNAWAHCFCTEHWSLFALTSALLHILSTFDPSAPVLLATCTAVLLGTCTAVLLATCTAILLGICYLCKSVTLLNMPLHAGVVLISKYEILLGTFLYSCASVYVSHCTGLWTSLPAGGMMGLWADMCEGDNCDIGGSDACALGAAQKYHKFSAHCGARQAVPRKTLPS
jgi:hypothetical protein